MKLCLTSGYRLIAVALILFFCSAVHAQSDQLPAGWFESRDTDKNAATYTKKNDTSSSIVKIYPPERLGQFTADEWLRDKLTSSKAPKGTWVDNLSISRSTANVSYGQRSFKLKDGRQGRLDALVTTFDEVSIRLGVSIYIPTDDSGSLVVKESVALLTSKLSQFAKADFEENKIGTRVEERPPEVADIEPGGVDIKPGLYTGTIFKNNGDVLGKHEVVLYENGEYEYLNRDRQGKYTYSKGTGRFEMGEYFRYSNHNDGFGIYGIDKTTNEYTMYGEKDRAFGNLVIRLAWTSPPDRSPPSIREEQEKLQKAEEKRYKYTTAPGEGIKESDIEAVLYTWELRVVIGGNEFVVEPYLLMNDGRVMDNIPVAPSVLDEAKSRSREPDRWGWWKREDDKFVFAWPKDKNKFRSPSGTQDIAIPIPVGTRLEGTWRMGRSSGTIATTVISFRSVTFTRDGRFETNSSMSVGVDGEQMGGDGYVGTSANDEISTSSASVGPLSSGSWSNSGKSGDDRRGSYEFDGYNLTLEYDNGDVVREFTFAMNSEYTQLWFKGGSLKRNE